MARPAQCPRQRLVRLVPRRRTKRLAARAPKLDIFSDRLVVRDDTGWRITDKGRQFLAALEAPITVASSQEQPSEVDAAVIRPLGANGWIEFADVKAFANLDADLLQLSEDRLIGDMGRPAPRCREREPSTSSVMRAEADIDAQRKSRPKAALIWLAALILILAHYAKIVFGVLVIILRHDPVPGQSFGAGQRRIAFIASLEILNVHRLWADKDGRLIWGAPYAAFKEFFSEHGRSVALGTSR
jgi:hypothetical protein